MAGGDTLATVGEKVTDVFVHAFATGNSNVSLVFLPFALPTPDDIVQGGVVNPTRLAAFLVPNFDAPYLMSPSQYSVHGQDLYYGTASQIYRLAVTAARPTAPVGSDAWTRINSEIAMAQTMLSPAGVTPEFACVPDDWVLPDSTYWSTFDSTQAQTAAPPQSSGPQLQLQRAVNPYLWTIKPAEQQDAPVQNLTYLHELNPALVAAATENTVPAVSTPPATTVAPVARLNPAVLQRIPLSTAAARPSGADAAAVRQAIRVLPQLTPTSDVPRIRPYPIIWRGPIDPPPPPPARTDRQSHCRSTTLGPGHSIAPRC
ncbi:hypothetical protein A5646_24425 [Mycobacterium sp. 1245499.0]|uniref:hypothetical protein n=1 Tax=Mycobacterium sp. 1245499.0 TaxID=1834074 RepID=UPI0007FF7AF4|nr:hypothetical protein [Mycobacterium sp. 1245499.0]OBK97408.1 hypothetical protein A5646_24425 [Mycobacterium sp. 1245499.0]